MNYKVDLYNPNEVVEDEDGHEDHTPAQAAIVVEEVHFDGGKYWVRLVGTDPSCYPAMARNRGRVGETRMWTSKDLTLHLTREDPLQVLNVSPTHEGTPCPNPNY